MTEPVSWVGAPRIEAFATAIDSAEGRCHLWLNANRSRIHGRLDLVTRRWKPAGSYQALADVVRDFSARDGWRDFRATLDDNRFPQGRRREADERRTGIAAHPVQRPHSA